MTNPINPLGKATTGAVGGSANKSPAKSSTEESNPANSNGSGDTVSLSQESQQVIELQQRLKTTSEIDTAKVEAIKQEIAKGNYPLDPEKIAENMINLEKSLLE